MHSEETEGLGSGKPGAGNAAPPAECANCGATLQGPFCHVCGQPLKTPIRELTSLATDLIEFVTDIDGRFFKSLGLLYFRPGKLTARYLGGQRVRFIRPLRMYIGLSILLFLAVSFTPGLQIQTGENGNLGLTINTDGEVSENVDPKTLEQLEALRQNPDLAKVLPPDLEQRIQEAAAAQEVAQGLPPELKPKRERKITFFGDQPWHRQDNPLIISWLSDSANDDLNDLIERTVHNIDKVEEDPQRLLSGFLDVMPQTMFVLLPLFALLLKFSYLFKRRLYVEHLIVALHSHSFLFLSFLLLLGFGQLGGWLPFLEATTNAISIAIGVWMPIYLFLMQKRVYAQGWIMTGLKYTFIGWVYIFLISFGMVGALLISLMFL
jgi:hypothetical protein